MKTNSKALLLSVVVVLLFASIYTSVGLQEADALKSKKSQKISHAKAKRGMLAQLANKQMSR